LILRLVRLLQLTSPALPVGAYTYSQGLEWAVACGMIKDQASAARWIHDALTQQVAAWEAPLAAALLHAWREGDDAHVAELNASFNASRETAELRTETTQMGWSLVRLLTGLEAFTVQPGWTSRLLAVPEPAFPSAWTAAAAAWRIDPAQAIAAYLWMWLENQVMAAVKTIPLGQSAGQRLLAELGGQIPALAAAAITRTPQDWHNFTPALAIASSRHETQYTRLFRS